MQVKSWLPWNHPVHTNGYTLTNTDYWLSAQCWIVLGREAIAEWNEKFSFFFFFKKTTHISFYFIIYLNIGRNQFVHSNGSFCIFIYDRTFLNIPWHFFLHTIYLLPFNLKVTQLLNNCLPGVIEFVIGQYKRINSAI